MTAISLADFDSPAEATLDRGVWGRNCEALEREQPRFARSLMEAATPEPRAAVISIDGYAAFVGGPGGADQWPGGSAIPRTRAAAMVRDFQAGELNATLPALGSGAELREMLAVLPFHKAVFVFVEDIAAAGWVLRLQDFSAEIASGRLVFLGTGHEREDLDAILREHAGLLPAGNMLRVPGVTEARIEFARGVCGDAIREISRRRKVELEELAATRRDAAAGRSKRICVVSLSTSGLGRRAAESLAAAAEGVGDEVCCSMVSGPRDVHVLGHTRTLAEFGPTLTIFVDSNRRGITLGGLGRACEWHVRLDGVPATMGNVDAVQLAASPAIEKALKRAGGAEMRVFPFYWACDGRGAEAGETSDAIVLVGDLTDSRAEACGIDLPTHQILWRQLHDSAEKSWGAEGVPDARTLLGAAERACGVRLTDERLRESMLGLVERRLIPAVVLGKVCEWLRATSRRVVVVGTGWGDDGRGTAGLTRFSEDGDTRGLRGGERISRSHCSQSSGTREGESEGIEWRGEDFWGYCGREGVATPAAAIFAGGSDLLSAELVTAAGLGWPLMLCVPPKTKPARELGGVLTPGQHVSTFSSGSDLRSVMAKLEKEPQTFRVMAERTRAYVNSRHSFACRLRSLMDALGAGADD